MALTIKNITPYFQSPQKGSFLISEPFLADYNFRRSVVLLSDHNEEGSVGFVLNREVDLSTDDVIPGLLQHRFPLYFGGPVEPNTLHFIHSVGELIPGAQHIANGIYWGGDIEMIDDLLNRKIADPAAFRFFSGYSGWAAGQLEEEIQEKAWWVGAGSAKMVFEDNQENMWKNIVKNLGNDFSYMANAPEDRSWN